MNAIRLPLPATERIGRVIARMMRVTRRRSAGRAADARRASRGAGQVDTDACTTFIRIWVDADALRPGSTDGIHVADNRSDQGSRHQGTPVLSTCVQAGSCICWEIFNISPVSDVQLRIRAILPSPLFAGGASPGPAPDNADAHTAIAGGAGRGTYAITFDVMRPGRKTMRCRITPTLSVLEPAA